MPLAAEALVSGTTFYFAGAGNNITNVASLHAAIVGVAIGSYRVCTVGQPNSSSG